MRAGMQNKMHYLLCLRKHTQYLSSFYLICLLVSLPVFLLDSLSRLIREGTLVILFLNLQCLEQCQAHRRHSKYICWMNENKYFNCAHMKTRKGYHCTKTKLRMKRGPLHHQGIRHSLLKEFPLLLLIADSDFGNTVAKKHKVPVLTELMIYRLTQ